MNKLFIGIFYNHKDSIDMQDANAKILFRFLQDILPPDLTNIKRHLYKSENYILQNNKYIHTNVFL